MRKLKFMPYAQAHINELNDRIQLISYQTIVIELFNDGTIYCTGLYSMTTRKHISAFLKEFTDIDFSLIKWLCEHNYAYNLETGELII